MNYRYQVDLIDMQSNPDGDMKFILVYQDHLTKRCTEETNLTYAKTIF